MDIEDILTKTILFVSKQFYSSLRILFNYQKLKICANEEHMNQTGSVEVTTNPWMGAKRMRKAKNDWINERCIEMETEMKGNNTIQVYSILKALTEKGQGDRQISETKTAPSLPKKSSTWEMDRVLQRTLQLRTEHR